jgi:3-O-methylgallate 3,4-dioxygenase
MRMASIVLGVATAHTPLLILPASMWGDYAERDRLNPELVFPPDGLAMPFDEAMNGAAPTVVPGRPGALSDFQRQFAAGQRSLDVLALTLRQARPDVVVIISDDQDEWFYDDNMPSLAIYWGESVRMIPRPRPTAGSPRDIGITQMINDGYAAMEADIPVDASLGRFLIEYLVEHDFDVSHMHHPRSTYSGSVHRRYPRADGSELGYVRSQPVRPVGLPHGFSFVVQRLLAGVPAPIVPVFQNTCYPPNSLTPRRSYALGEALAGALAAYPADARVAVIASGGLSHFVVDEELDRALLEALKSADEQALVSLPRHRLRSGTSECLNWVALGGLMAGQQLEMELIGYEPVYRTEAGTGAGLGFARWCPPAGLADGRDDEHGLREAGVDRP